MRKKKHALSQGSLSILPVAELQMSQLFDPELAHVEEEQNLLHGIYLQAPQCRAWPAVGTQYIKVVINAYEIRSTERETERVCEVGAVQEGVEGVISVICSHTRFYLGKQRGEDNRKRGHVLKSIIYCCPDDILVTRKPPELVCLWLPI